MLKTRNSGFTIVELLIVIVVIAILAAISIVAYNGVQSRANNSRILSAVNQVEKAMRIWHIDTGKQPKAGSGSTSGPTNDECVGPSSVGGWFGGNLYNCNMEDLLVARGGLPSGFTANLPPNKTYTTTNGRYSLMLYPCSNIQNGYILFYNMYGPSQDDYDKFNIETMKCGGYSPNASVVYNNYGMRGGRIITLN